MSFVVNTGRILTQDDFDKFLRNGQPVDYVMAGRMVETIRTMFQLERAAKMLTHFQPGIYSNIEMALGNLEAGRQL